MDSGSALRCARNDSFDQSPNATNQRGRDPNPAASNKRCSLPVAPKHTSPQRATALPHGRHANPAIDHRPFGIPKRTIGPLVTTPARRSGQTDPIPPSQARCPRHCQTPPTAPRTDPAALSKHPPPSVDAANAPHPKGNGVAAWQTHKSRHRSPAFRHLRTHHRPAGNQSCQPIPATRPTDPVQTQFGPADSRHCHTSPTGLAPDWTELDLTSFASPRLSLPRTNALALRTHLSRHDKHPFFANFAWPYGKNTPPP